MPRRQRSKTGQRFPGDSLRHRSQARRSRSHSLTPNQSPEDLGDLICYIATLPKHVCLNEILISPTWNRGYVATLQQAQLKV